MGAGERVQAPPRVEATAGRGADRARTLEGSRMAAGTAVGAWVLVLSLWGAVVGAQNITARIGEPLVLKCKGAPKKPPQRLEWKLNTGRTEAWKVLSPQGGGPWDSVARVLPNGSLFLPAVGIQDEGIFRCQAMNRNGKETKSNYRVRVYQIPGKPEIVDSASELTAGVPNKVGTCVSEGSYPAGTLSWHLDGKPLVPNEKGVSVKEQTRRHPETGLFTLQSELMVTPARGGDPHPTFSCSFSPGLPRHRALRTAPIQPRVWEPVPLEEVQLVVEPEGGAVAPGGTVTLTCEVPAQPSPQIHWMKDGLRTREPTAVWPPIPATGPRKAVLSASASSNQARRGQLQVRGLIKSGKQKIAPNTCDWGDGQQERNGRPQKTRRKRRSVQN
ncbi:advanced glycosylation end product-specific receptor isoform X4 [Gorilla gorilla gorilla]|uniref:advanced glycosylation end product-specific receptor isoform X4 n=1 Tax=Gorilla gorilla gorilla TaxID=9595 RepID=UPI00029D9CC7|nr:advanced glycosylation end product-specific receptor isoform X3 [Gorilla gorilla gorilla]